MENKIKSLYLRIMLVLCTAMLFMACSTSGDKKSATGLLDIPVIVPGKSMPFPPHNTITFDQLNNITGGNKKGLTIDLEDPTIWGKIYISQYPFEAGGKSDYDYAYYIDTIGKLERGAGVLHVGKLYKPMYDANNWREGGVSTASKTAAYRLELFQYGKGHVGAYGSFVSFEKNADGVFQKLPTIIDGPYVTMISSDSPTSMEIVWKTDEPCTGEVSLGDKTYSEDAGETVSHNVRITGLTPDTEYKYTVRSQASDGRKVVSNTYNSRTAPEKGQGQITFAFASDSRSGGGGGGEWNYMGCNAYILNQIVGDAYRKGADFFLFGGDLIWGLTTSKKDYSLQIGAWKQSMAPFWRSRPVYAGMGNHDFVFNVFDGFYALDKWPYATDSGEAMFAAEMYNPTNGPEPSDSRRPSYRENVYSFQYGPVKVISFNNTYWATDFRASTSKYGGSFTGYIMADQLKWIEDTVMDAEKDATVKYIFLFTHSPVFPTMGHSKDAMWHKGNNNKRAYTKNANTGKLEPEALGVVEVRNRLWKAIAGSPKTVAVFTGDEHAYHRTLITSKTPVGIYPDDDTDGDGVLDKYSPNPEFSHPVWHITCGGGGAPYRAGQKSMPWTPEILTSEYGYVLVRADGDNASLEFIANRSGKVLDKVEFENKRK